MKTILIVACRTVTPRNNVPVEWPIIFGAIQVLRNADGGGVKFSGKKRYEGVRFNVICVTRGWVAVQFLEKSLDGPFKLVRYCPT